MSFSVEVIDKLSELITAAFGLVAALAWNTAIQAIFTEVFKERGSILAMLVYAVTVTIIAVAFTIWIGYLAKQAKSISD
jgi:NhaP-type Na+/H+ or K+/H+ antiporter